MAKTILGGISHEQPATCYYCITHIVPQVSEAARSVTPLARIKHITWEEERLLCCVSILTIPLCGSHELSSIQFNLNISNHRADEQSCDLGEFTQTVHSISDRYCGKTCIHAIHTRSGTGKSDPSACDIVWASLCPTLSPAFCNVY